MCGSLGTALPQNSRPAAVVGPRIEFATPIYDFGRITAGVVVKHDFVFTNTGDAVLEVDSVLGGDYRGEWEKRVAPGQTGKIPIQFNSANFTGPVRKSLTVTCNDSNHPTTILQFKGTVWRPIEVRPMYAIFTPLVDEQTNETQTLRVVNNTDAPVTLSGPESANPSFKAEVKTVKEGKEFELLISRVPPFGQANVSAPITIKTSSKQMPTLSVEALVMLKHAVEVMPSQIMLGPPTTNVTKYVVIIRNNAAAELVLSEPTASVPGVEVQMQETVPRGRQFNLAVTFPAGFTVRQGQSVEVTVRSNHPKFPRIKVPVSQLPARDNQKRRRSHSAPAARWSRSVPYNRIQNISFGPGTTAWPVVSEMTNAM